MLTAVVSGLLCGNRGYKAIVEWLHDLPVDVWHWMGYTRTPPKQDCFRDLLMKLDPLVLEGRVIVGDAMFCQRDLCEQIVDSGGDYFFTVKENQPTLLREIELELAAEEAAFSPLRTARAGTSA